MFSYHMPTNIQFGKQILLKQGHLLKSQGKKALIVTGANSAKKSGALDDARQVLKKLAIDYEIYSEIKENPDLESIHNGAVQMKKSGSDFVIGIGGGSPVDAAKAISVVAANDFQNDEFYQSGNIKKAHPIISITTTSGTGTEATPYSVVTNCDKKAGFGSPLMFPTLSFLDPTYTFSMPDKVTRDTAIDALSHLLEGIYSAKRCPLLYPLITTGVRVIYSVLEEALAEPENFEHRKQLMIASLYGGMVIAQSSTTLQHSIGYPLTTFYGLSHGMANGVVMKHIMELYYPYLNDEIDMLFTHLNCSRNDFYKWLDKLGMKTSLKLDKEFIDKATDQIEKSRNMALNPLQVKRDQVAHILAQL